MTKEVEGLAESKSPFAVFHVHHLASHYVVEESVRAN